jgi:hypothetical protein
MKKTAIISIVAALILGCVSSRAQTSGAPSLSMQVLSSKTLSGTAGDFVTVEGQITNTGSKPLGDVTTYLSLMDNQNKLPVDLEDWSAEKGLYIGTIDAGQTLPLNWKIHFVKAGTYSLIIIAEAAGNDLPQVSSVTQFNVSPKRNLNPGQVLPIALGTPIVLIFILFMLSYKRRVDE